MRVKSSYWKPCIIACTRLLLLFFLLFGLSLPATAIDRADIGRPKWEAGLGLVALYHPFYLGADQGKFYMLPVPYFVYRGEYIRAGRGGLRGEIYESERLDLRISIGGSLPVSSDDSKAREGMEDIDLLVEAGPSLQYKLLETPTQMWRLDLPVRGVFSLGSRFLRQEGWITNPGVRHEFYIGNWTVTSRLSVVFSDRHYHAYIYDVGYADVTPDRPYFRSRSGYTGTKAGIGVRRRIGDYYVGARLSYYNLHGAVNSDSPLMKKNEYLSASLAVAWVFGESEERVSRPIR